MAEVEELVNTVEFIKGGSELSILIALFLPLIVFFQYLIMYFANVNVDFVILKCTLFATPLSVLCV